jgi:protein-tyrosine phosphatase
MPQYDMFTRPVRERLHQIRDNIWIGNKNAVDRDLIDNGITAIINLAYEIDDGDVPPDMMRTVKVALVDDSSNHPYMVDLAVTVLDKMIENGERVLVHCIAGRSRSPHIVATYLSRKEGKSYDEVYAEIRKKRPETLEQSMLYDSESH